MMKPSPTLLLLVLAIASVNAGTYRTVCYYTNWAQYRSGSGRFLPKDIDPFLCTHVIYAFATFNGAPAFNLKTHEWNDEQMYKQVIALKDQNPDLKVLLAVGGYNFGPGPFSKMSSSASGRANFAGNAIKFLRRYRFDGLDVDWEFPGELNRGGTTQDKTNYPLLMKVLRDEFKNEAKATGKNRLILSAAVPVGNYYLGLGFNIGNFIKYPDFVNLMAYDMHGPWEAFTGHNAPLYPRDDEDGAQRTVNVEWGVEKWLRDGAPASKLNLGMPMYGRCVLLANPNQHDLGDPINRQACPAGPYTRQNGFFSYYEMCKNLRDGFTRYWDQASAVPYAVKGNQWAAYDDRESIGLKAAFTKEKGLGGAMIWALDFDDFTGSQCNQGKYPLLTKINEVLGSDTPATTTTTTTRPTPTQSTTRATTRPTTTRRTTTRRPTTRSTTAPTTTSTSPPTGGKCEPFMCTDDGNFPDPLNCHVYHQCVYTHTNFPLHVTHQCLGDTIYFPELGQCVFEHQIINAVDYCTQCTAMSRLEAASIRIEPTYRPQPVTFEYSNFHGRQS